MQTHQQSGECALSAAGFAHEGERGTAWDREAHSVNCAQQACLTTAEQTAQPGGREIEGLAQAFHPHKCFARLCCVAAGEGARAQGVHAG